MVRTEVLEEDEEEDLGKSHFSPLLLFRKVLSQFMMHEVLSFLIRFRKTYFFGGKLFVLLLLAFPSLFPLKAPLAPLWFSIQMQQEEFSPMYGKLPHFYPKRGAASIGGKNPDDVWFSSFLSWPPSLLSTALSSYLHAFGHKSSTLEAIALCLPLLTIPELCLNRHICFYTDNKALVSG